MTHNELRKKVVEYISLSKADFRQFLSLEPGDTMEYETFLRDVLQVMAENDYWVGYESIMAISRYLEAAILVTSGGTTNIDPVHTNSFYFGEKRPKKHIHIVWVSFGFYDPAVQVWGDIHINVVGTRVAQRDDNSFTRVIRELSEQDSRADVDDGIMRRHPSHVCECQTSCECRHWVKVDTLPPPSPKQLDMFWNRVFLFLCDKAPVLQKWKTIVRHLNLEATTVEEIDSASKNLSEKAYEALSSWRIGNIAADVTVAKILESLQNAKLVSVAGMVI